MKKFALLLLTFHFTFIGLSQSKKLTVSYKTRSSYVPPKIDSLDTMFFLKSNYMKKLRQNIEDMEYTLEIDGEKSEYKVALRLQFVDEETNGFTFRQKDRRFYVDNEVFLEQIVFLEEEYLLTEKANYYHWKLENESKEILGYTCYKATYEVTEPFGEKIDAWYAPELAFPFGPNGFHGLPGLILETVRNDLLSTKASLIVHDQKQIISKPSTGKEVSRLEFDKKLKEHLVYMGFEKEN